MVLLKGGYVVTPQEVVRRDVVIRDGKVELGDEGRQGETVIDVSGKYIVPGFVDIHNHGYNLFDFTAGLYDPKTETYDNSEETYTQCFDMLGRQYAAFGVTGFYLATWTEKITTLNHCYGQLADYLARPKERPSGARLRGGFLEGPFINPDMAGAMNSALVKEPTRETFERIEDGGSIKLALVAPETGSKSNELIEYLSNKGIVVGIGHTSATCDQVAAAVKAGLKYCVHFTNGPTGGSFKPFDGGGAIEAVLKLDELYAEQICDGYHINPAYVRDIIKRKGVGKILGITDCGFAAGSEVKEFVSGGVHGAVSEDGNYLRVLGKVNTLFGSNLTMKRGFKNVVNWLTSDMEGIWNRRHEAMSLDEALVAAATMFSSNPCKLMGLAEQGYGTIVDGAQADLTVLDMAGSEGNYSITVENTIVSGNIVHSAQRVG